MSGIQSSVGLITGLPIEETVNKLMAISARPRDNLTARNAALKQEQVAINDLTVGVVALELAAERLGNTSTYATRNVTSSDTDKLTTVVTGTPVAGTYVFTPLATAQSHHLLSSGIASDTAALGAGTFSFHQAEENETYSITLDADDTIRDLAAKINALDANVAASVINDGSGTPYRLSFVSTKTGEDFEIVIESNATGLTFSEISAARDAELAIGDADSEVVVKSSTNEFAEVLDGVKLTVKAESDTPITVTVNESDSGIVTNAKLLAEQYNKLQTKLATYTKFDSRTNTTGILFGSGAVLQVQNQVSALITGRIFGAGDIQTLSELGFSVNDQGELSLDEAKLKAKYAEDPDAVRAFFTTEDSGFSDRMKATTDKLAGVGNSVLLLRNQSLQRKIEFANERITFFNERLTRERDRLLKSFYELENIVAKFQATTSSINALASQFAASSSSSRS